MRGLSLWQPWAHFIRMEWKGIETRSWGTTYRGLVAIHAAVEKRDCTPENVYRLLWRSGLLYPELSPGEAALEVAALRSKHDADMAFGAFVAVARIADCQEMVDVTRVGPAERTGDPAIEVAWHRMQAPGEAPCRSAGTVTRLEEALGGYAPGRFGWFLQDVIPLRRPVPARGRQGLWTLSDEETMNVYAEVA